MSATKVAISSRMIKMMTNSGMAAAVWLFVAELLPKGGACATIDSIADTPVINSFSSKKLTD
jgi:hypothetical protein